MPISTIAIAISTLFGDGLAGRTDDQPFQFRDLKACIAKACDPQFLRKDGKAANLICNKARVWP